MSTPFGCVWRTVLETRAITELIVVTPVAA